MTALIDLTGASGTRYRFTKMEENRFLPPAGANYVIAHLKIGGPTVVFVGETDNLASQSWRVELDKARETIADAVVLTRLNVTRSTRDAERTDLIQNYHPPMNS